jgi:hypothetical protein
MEMNVRLVLKKETVHNEKPLEIVLSKKQKIIVEE